MVETITDLTSYAVLKRLQTGQDRLQTALQEFICMVSCFTGFINACTAALERQATAANGWPVPLILPEPENAAENQGLELFLAEIRQATGAKVKFKLRKRAH